MMMMMMMTLMKLVNSATKFRHEMDKFYQPNSGLRGSKSGDEAIYTYTHMYRRQFNASHARIWAFLKVMCGPGRALPT